MSVCGLILCHWSLSITPVNVRKQEFFWCMQEVNKGSSVIKWVNSMVRSRSCTVDCLSWVSMTMRLCGEFDKAALLRKEWIFNKFPSKVCLSKWPATLHNTPLVQPTLDLLFRMEWPSSYLLYVTTWGKLRLTDSILTKAVKSQFHVLDFREFLSYIAHSIARLSDWTSCSSHWCNQYPHLHETVGAYYICYASQFWKKKILR